MVRAGDDGEEPSSEPIAVDHDVEREEQGAHPVRGGAKDAYGVSERRRADGARRRVVLETAKPFRERGAQMRAGELVRESRAQRRLVLEKRRRLRHQRRDREGDEEKREDEEDREDDRDSEPAPHALLFEPAAGRAQRAGDEEASAKPTTPGRS